MFVRTVVIMVVISIVPIGIHNNDDDFSGVHKNVMTLVVSIRMLITLVLLVRKW